MEAIARAKVFSEARIQLLREGLDAVVPKEAVVVTCGSYARREASAKSDLDYFLILPKSLVSGKQAEAAREPAWFQSARSAICNVVPAAPATGGAFDWMESPETILNNIGGNNDSNPKFTRRMLFLLEGEWLSNAVDFKGVRRQILERYIRPGMTDHQLALFLLNDIIRYYRTMAVDYEFKTVEGDAPKPWGIRNIKLVFSRKLLYASGLFSVAMTVDRTREQKIEVLDRLFQMPVIDRMVDICGPTAMGSVLASYDQFLRRLEDEAVRTRLAGLQPEQRGDALFRELKNEGHHFTRELMRLFERTFDSTHPIRRAIVF